MAEEQRSRNIAANVLLENIVKKDEVVEEIKKTETSGLDHQAVIDDEIEAAREVVNNVVHAAILKVQEEKQDTEKAASINSTSNNQEISNEHKKSRSRDDIASEFYKSGKDAAEKLVKIVDSNVNNKNNDDINNSNSSNIKNDTNVLN